MSIFEEYGVFKGRIQVAKLLVVQTVEHMVLSLNPAEGRIQLMNAWHFIAQSLL